MLSHKRWVMLAAGALAIVLFFVLVRGCVPDANAAEGDMPFYGEASVTTDYRHRGVSLSQGNPSIGAEFGYDNGWLYLGAGGNSVDLVPGDTPTAEFYGVAGITPTVDFGAVEAGIDLGVTYRTYYDTPGGWPDPDYWEGHAGASLVLWSVDVSGTVYYSPEFMFESGSAITYEGRVGYDLWENLNLSAGAGQTHIDEAPAPIDQWTYYDVTLATNFYGFDLSASYVGNDISSGALPGALQSSVDDGIVFTVSRRF